MDPVEALRACYAFEGVPDRQIRELAVLSETKEYEAGDVLLQHNEESSHMFVVLEGEAVAVAKSGETIAKFGPGTIFGEMSLVAGAPRSATVKASEDTKLAQIYAPPVLAMMDNDPRLGYTIAANLARLLCKRLVSANELVEGLSVKPEAEAV